MTGMILATECHDGQVTDPKLAVRLLGEIAKGGQNDQG